MEDVTRGLNGRRACGGAQVTFGIFILLGSIQSFNFISVLTGLFIIVTGSLGIASKARGTVIAYTVTGIICTLLLAVSLVLSVVAIITLGDTLTGDTTTFAILIGALVIIAVVMIVSILGVIFAFLPLCGDDEPEERPPPKYPEYSNTGRVV